MIYDGAIMDTTNSRSDRYIKINSCNTQKSLGKAYTVIRRAGRVDYHVLYVVRGQCICLYGDTEKTMTSGELVIYEPGREQKYSFPKGSDVITMWIHFTGSAVQGIFEELGITGGFHKVGLFMEVERCFEDIINKTATGAVSDSVCAEGCLIKLLSLISDKSTDSHYPKVVSDMLAYVNTNWQRPLCVGEIASAVGLSESRAAHLFSMNVGQSIKEYVKRIRIKSSMELLRTTSMSVSRIADMVGYGDALYFSRVFKASAGVSPAAYRKQSIDKSDNM